MKIFITGGTGLIGSQLIPLLIEKKHQISVLSRDSKKVHNQLGGAVSCFNSLNELKSLEDYDAVINLAGEAIANKRWTQKQKKKLIESRLNISHALSSLILAGTKAPKVFISGSAIGFYGGQASNLILNEESKVHEEFTHELCKQWESAALAAQSSNTRVCLLRTGIVLAKDGGALKKMLPAFRLGLGASIASGNQSLSWIHIEDMIGAILFLLDNPNARGAFNLTAPNPVSNRLFSQNLARVLRRPCWFRVPAFFLYFVLGEAASLLVNGQYAIPKKLLEFDFVFKHPQLREALDDLLN